MMVAALRVQISCCLYFIQILIVNGLNSQWGLAKSKLAFWQSVACSASGSHLVAVAFGGTIYRSNDAGFNWNEVYYMDSQWMDVTSDMNGINLAAVSVSDGVYYSLNGGGMWNQSVLPATKMWSRVASSSTGQYLIVAALYGPIYYSDSHGISFLPSGSSNGSMPINAVWTSVAVSADGRRMISTATVTHGYPDGIYLSVNSGRDWKLIQQTSGILWKDCAISQEVSPNFAVAVSTGGIYVSTDGGSAWVLTSAPNNDWSAVAMSQDGQVIVASTGSPAVAGQIYYSSDFGTTWQAESTAPVVKYSSLSIDYAGYLITAVVGDINGGGVLVNRETSNPTPAPTATTARDGVGDAYTTFPPGIVAGIVFFALGACVAVINLSYCYYDRKVENASDFEKKNILEAERKGLISRLFKHSPSLSSIGEHTHTKRKTSRILHHNNNSSSSSTSQASLLYAPDEDIIVTNPVTRDMRKEPTIISSHSKPNDEKHRSSSSRDAAAAVTGSAHTTAAHTPRKASHGVAQAADISPKYGIEGVSPTPTNRLLTTRPSRQAVLTPSFAAVDEETADGLAEAREYLSSSKAHLEKSAKGKPLRENTLLLLDDDCNDEGDEVDIK